MGSKNKTSIVLKILGVIFGIGFLIVLILVGIIFYQLPSAQQLGRFFKKENTEQHKKVPDIKNHESTLAHESSLDFSKSYVEHNNSLDRPINHDEKANELKELREFLDDKTPAISFCTKLHYAKTGPITELNNLKKSKDENTTRTEIKSEEFSESEDLRLEAIKPFFKKVLKQPEMQKLIYMVIQDDEFRNSSESTQQGLFDKALFYKQAFSAYSEMKENLPVYETIVDRSYLMYKLNDLMAYKPDLQNDPRITKFCEEREYEFNSDLPVDYENEKKVFERLIQELGVDPHAIKYDPQYKTVLKLDFSGNNLQIGGGWLNELMPKDSEVSQH